jgi:hypothetical protein
MYYQVYAVKNRRQPNEQRDLINFTPSKRRAEFSVMNALASGFDYCYIKQGFEVVKSYNSSSFIRE